MRRSSILFPLFVLASACSNGGSGGSSTPTPTVTPTPTLTPTPTPTPAATVKGSIAVIDETLTDSAAAGLGGIRGGRVEAAFLDLTSGGGQVLFGTGAIGECTIVRYDATHLPNPPLDGGTVTVANASAGAGLLGTVGPCLYVASAGGYRCISTTATAQSATTTDAPNPPSGVIAYTFPAQSFAGQNLVGSWAIVNGFADTAFNSGSSAFPIVSQPDGTSLALVDAAGEGHAGETAAAASLTVLNGYGPVPLAGAAADFLGGSTGSIRITKPSTAVWPAIDVTLPTRGEGYTLDDASAQPAAFPTVSANQVYSCAGTNGSCGQDAMTSAVKMMKLSGRVTRESLAGLASFQMPAQPAGSDYLDFECSAVFADSITMPAAAVQTILDWNPGVTRRIEMRVERVTASELTDGLNGTEILAGHALVGHTDL